jgi:hypothetical protein
VKHLPGRGDKLTECALHAVRPDELTTDITEMTCPDCVRSLIRRWVCPSCGGAKSLEWGTHPNNKSTVANGRLTLNDVETVFYLACTYCSETVLPHVDPELIAEQLTQLRWLP